jgi:hypothetical protein
LEFQHILDTLPPAPERRAKRPVKVLGFLRDLIQRKYKRGLTDVDLMVLTALAYTATPPRFVQVVGLVPGISQTGTWNSLDRLEGNGLILVGGPPLAHTYSISNEGIKTLAHLAGKA